MNRLKHINLVDLEGNDMNYLLLIPRAQSTLDMISQARHEREVEKIKAGMLDSLFTAKIHSTGEVGAITTRIRAYYETDARERIEMKRRERNDIR